MHIQFFNYMIAIGANWRNILFLLGIVYSILITIFYFKGKLETEDMKNYYEEQIVSLEDSCKVDKDTLKIKFYEQYITEKGRLIDEYSLLARSTPKVQEYSVNFSKYDKELIEEDTELNIDIEEEK